MLSTTVPISPPVTPKELVHEDFCEHNDEPLFIPVRKDNHPIKKKSIPKKSPINTKNSFTMDLLKDVLSVLAKPSPTFDAFSILNTERHVKKSKTDAAAAYDLVDISIPDHQVFKDDPKWIPNMKKFEEKRNIKVSWKGSPLYIKDLPCYQLLHPSEEHVASILRLTPEQYLKCKRSLILAAREFHKSNTQFRKSDAQKCVRIDVNKTSALWSVFNQLGWFNPT